MVRCSERSVKRSVNRPHAVARPLNPDMGLGGGPVPPAMGLARENGVNWVALPALLAHKASFKCTGSRQVH